MKDDQPSFNRNAFFSSNHLLNKGPSNHPSQSIFLKKGNNPHFQIFSLYNDFEQNELALKEFIGVAIADLTKLKFKILDAFHNSDLVIYQQAHYKTLTTLKMIHAKTLLDLLMEGKDLIEREGNHSETVVFRNLDKEFSAVLNCLKAME